MKKSCFLALLVFTAWLGQANAATFYVATNGNNTSGDGTKQKPWETIGFGIGKMSAGDTLIVKPGIYTGTANFISGIPSGAPGNYSVVKAEEPLTVTITNGGSSLDYYDYLIQLENNYTKADGFIIDAINTRYPPHNGRISGNYNKITRSIFRKEGVVDTYGGWLFVTGDYNLVEDVAGVGGARYGFESGGPNSTASYNIFRRVVGRVDYSGSDQPKAAFAVYGNNSGYGVHDYLLQNCIAIDGHRGPSSSEDTYGGVYFPKNAAEVTIQGSIVLNNEAGHAGYFIKELGGRNIKLEHSIAWGIYGSSHIVGIRGNSSSGPWIIDHVTVGDTASAIQNRSSDVEELSNSLFYNNGSLYSSNYGFDVETNNAFNPASQANGANAVTNNVTLKYIVRSEPGSGMENAANDGTNVGADVTVQYGVSGTLWGEAGFDQRTTKPLWPWAYEDKIKEVFARSNPSPSGYTPGSNNTIRGFTVGTDQFGKEMTLTRYIWQYLGNEIPAGIYKVPDQLAQPSTRLLN